MKYYTQEDTPATGSVAEPQWASPPRQLELTPPGAAEFVICDHTIEVTIKEIKGGLHLGQMQVTSDKERVKRSVALPVCAYLLLVRLYGQDENLARFWSLFRLKQHFMADMASAQCDRIEAKWQRKLLKLKEAA